MSVTSGVVRYIVVLVTSVSWGGQLCQFWDGQQVFYQDTICDSILPLLLTTLLVAIMRPQAPVLSNKDPSGFIVHRQPNTNIIYLVQCQQGLFARHGVTNPTWGRDGTLG